MIETNTGTTVRPMDLEDLDAVFSIDHKIRGIGQTITYANLTTERIFTINRHVGRLAKPVSYVDLITGDISELLAHALVAEIEGHVRGFILGRVDHVGESASELGRIIIIGVHPDYQRKGIATGLVNELCANFRSRGIKRVCIDVDQRDKQLLDFVERLEFGVGHLISYSKAL